MQLVQNYILPANCPLLWVPYYSDSFNHSKLSNLFHNFGPKPQYAAQLIYLSTPTANYFYKVCRLFQQSVLK